MKSVQAVEGKNKMFEELYPVLYAAESPITAGYVRQSIIASVYADSLVLGGLRGKKILDLGCGFGTTTMEISKFCPGSITAIDNSTAMIELMKVVMLDDCNIDEWLQKKGADKILGDLYKGTLDYLNQRRADYRQGIFVRGGGSLNTLTSSVLDISNFILKIGRFDVAIANNMLHWPVKQLIESSSVDTETALNKVISRIEQTLLPGGILIITEPKDFITFDDDRSREIDSEKNTSTNHPVFKRFHATLNRILEDCYGIKRAVPSSTGLFKVSKLRDCFESQGFEYIQMSQRENSDYSDPIIWCQVRAQMWLGEVTLSFEEKNKIIQETVGEVRKTITGKEDPIRTQDFYICLRKK
ncbi:MAG: class I SAM-dependent methyltransferase [Patescibacteria group bacterium]|nr:class I SAM-dependent methyltransferase [Patescibacteria group bacterium]MDE1988438.1 class I SAM-dependent methyltransferase [Patescibacteria group bacterium]MDE2218584.1 class I SAM-dependent methyltransferase [Patescibacteria group bacterium]